jgi:hypothetical protein
VAFLAALEVDLKLLKNIIATTVTTAKMINTPIRIDFTIFLFIQLENLCKVRVFFWKTK